nr:reverse transcriptase domain-containing protein [Tanacetum cinerariifolium]
MGFGRGKQANEGSKGQLRRNYPRELRRNPLKARMVITIVTAERERKDKFHLLRKYGVTRGRIKLPRVGEAHITPRPSCKKTSKLNGPSNWWEHDIKFEGRDYVKGQILADFLLKTPSVEDKNMEIKKPEAANKAPSSKNTWKLYIDEASSFDSSGAGLMLVSLEGKEYTYALRFEFKTTNNEAEYEALLAGLRIADKMEIKDLDIFIDSQLLANQVKGLFEAR